MGHLLKRLVQKLRGTAHTSLPEKRHAGLFVPPGHFYSPLVEVPLSSIAARYTETRRSAKPLAVKLDYERMAATLRDLAPGFSLAKDLACGGEDARYQPQNDQYGPGDAFLLAAFLMHWRPEQVIEIGSGHSSALMLDTCDRAKLETKFTFIEPYPKRLLRLLSPKDTLHHTLLVEPVQNVAVERFSTLRDGDILFIDSSHVAKTGSDLLYELFEILPRLQPGVLVHFHDVFANFEYPQTWIDQGRSWNELYFLQAFLMHNDTYEILFMSHEFAKACPAKRAAIAPDWVGDPGGALWLRKTGPAL